MTCSCVHVLCARLLIAVVLPPRSAEAHIISAPPLDVLHAVCWHSVRKSGWSTSEELSLYVLRLPGAQLSALFSVCTVHV